MKIQIEAWFYNFVYSNFPDELCAILSVNGWRIKVNALFRKYELGAMGMNAEYFTG